MCGVPGGVVDFLAEKEEILLHVKEEILLYYYRFVPAASGLKHYSKHVYCTFMVDFIHRGSGMEPI